MGCDLKEAVRAGMALHILAEPAPTTKPALSGAPNDDDKLLRQDLTAEAGLILTDRPTPSMASAPRDQSAITMPNHRSVHRRLGRRLLRFLRPLGAPFLHRLDWRIRGAVDRSATGIAIARSEMMLADRLAAFSAELTQRHVSEIAPQIASTAKNVSSLEDQLHRVELRLEAIQLVAPGIAALAGQLREKISQLEIQLSRLDAKVIDSLSEQIATVSMRLQTRWEDRVAQLEAALAATLNRAEMEQRWDARLSMLGQNITSVEGRLNALIELEEMLLQRNCIPLGEEFAVRTDAGYLLVPGEDVQLLLAMVESRGRMEPGTLKVLRNLLNEGDVMIDVGANIGSLAIVAARCVGASGRVVAFEPTPRVADLLRRSAALNDLTARLQVEQCAAGEVDGEATFSISASTTHNSLFLEEGERILIAVRSIDSLIPPGGKVDLIKIDAEGSELQVWRGMQRVIANNPELAVIVEFGPSHLRRAGVTVASWLAELQTSGFVAWEIDEASGTVHPLRKQGLHEIFSLNLLLLRDPPSSRLGLRPT